MRCDLRRVAPTLLFVSACTLASDSGESSSGEGAEELPERTEGLEIDESGAAPVGHPVAGLESLSGEWRELWGPNANDLTRHAIDDRLWTRIEFDGSTYLLELAHANPDEEWLLARHHPEASWYPGMWVRVHWQRRDSQLWTCEVLPPQARADRALLQGADPNSDDLEAGCGGFAWRRLERESP